LQESCQEVRPVDTHRAHIVRKLQLETRAELVIFALATPARKDRSFFFPRPLHKLAHRRRPWVAPSPQTG
jgi:hypothetical protein